MRRRAAARHLRAGVGVAAASARLIPHGHRQRRSLALPTVALPTVALRSFVFGMGHEKTVAVAVAGIVLGASVLSIGTSRPTGDTGGPTGEGTAPRLALAGGADSAAVAGPAAIGTVEEGYAASLSPNVSILVAIGDIELSEPAVDEENEVAGVIAAAEAATTTTTQEAVVRGPFLDDGTLLKPVAVNTTVADGASLVRTYKVKAGDTLSGIADKFDVSMKTLWWANDLPDRHELHQGQVLRIPPVSGLVVEVKATDTLAGLAKQYKISAAKILKTNGLQDENLVVGQVLILPGAKGKPLPIPKPAKPKATSSSGSRSSGGGSVRPPRTYGGGNFRWPTTSHHISQYYHYGHYAIDIDGSTGDPIYAAASGTVTFAGWKSNGGGYQVWIAHGSGLYTTYNHMSSVSVGRGQHVGRGQRVGRMGATGIATGSHLHFEVWKGPVWNGGRRVNPLAYL
jgi:murein DD-endopeptidase MepM/ murein hydrolase activator NlpD